jgi:hypothetical protein
VDQEPVRGGFRAGRSGHRGPETTSQGLNREQAAQAVADYVRSKRYPEGARTAEIQDLGGGINKNNAGKLLRKLLDQLRIVRIKNLGGDQKNTKRWWAVPTSPLPGAWPVTFTHEVRTKLRNGEPIEQVIPDWKP